MKIEIERRNRARIFGFLPILLIGVFFSLLSVKVIRHKVTDGFLFISNKFSDSISIEKVDKLEELPDKYVKLLKMKPLGSKIFDIYRIETSGAYELIYVKKQSVSDTLTNSIFFIHVYPSNDSYLPEKQKQFGYTGFDFESNLKSYIFKDTLYYVAQSYPIPIVPMNRINTGQYGYKGNYSRIWETSLTQFTKETTTLSIDSLELNVKQEDFEKLKLKRLEALKLGVLLSSDDDFIPITIGHENKLFAAQMRLKGDWLDHIQKINKLSFRIELLDGQTLLGMSRFSIHHPGTRNYLYEWLFHKTMIKEGLIGLRYSFVSVGLRMNGKSNDLSFTNLGLYALEEGFDKYLIESNQKREGPILKFDESMIWKDRAFAFKAGDGVKLLDNEQLQYIGAINVFSPKEVLSSELLTKQFSTAKNLLNYFTANDKFSISKAFKMEDIAKFNALSNIFGATHGLISHNLRFYYNPVTSLLEPISFDCMGGERLNKILFYFNSKKDIAYLEKFAAALEQVSSEEYVEHIFTDSKEEINKNIDLLQTEFSTFGIDKNVLVTNARMIKKYINPSTAFTAYLDHMDETRIVIEVKSRTSFPIEILSLRYKNEKDIAFPENRIVNPLGSQYVIFQRPGSFDNLFVNKKKKIAGFKLANHLEDIVISYRIAGTSIIRTEGIVPYREREKDFEEKDLLRKPANFKEFDFIYLDEKEKTVTIQSGYRILDRDLIVPSGYQLIAGRGLHLDMTDSAKIISHSPLQFIGSKDSPIKIFSSDSTGQGVIVMSAQRESNLKFIVFENLTNPATSNWSLTGSVNFYESPVHIEYTDFLSNRSEDALNIIRTDFLIENVFFKNTQSDAFDGDFVKGKIINSEFDHLGNDAIDVSGSEVHIENVYITHARDKGISVGEKSRLTARKVIIKNSEIAVVSKDLSHFELDDLTVENCKLVFTAFNKKPEYGPASIKATNLKLVKNKMEYLIEVESKLLLNGRYVPTQRDVISKMYGVEYGKASD